MRKEKIDAIYNKLKEKTKKPCIKLEAYQNETESLTGSKIGGVPYLPLEMDFPRDSEGEAMYLLVQINCEALPPNDIYPDKGLVQFWLSEGADDSTYGLNFKELQNRQANWRILYHENIDEALSLEAVKGRYQPRCEDSPLEKDDNSEVVSFALAFQAGESFLPTEHETFSETFVALWNEAYPDDPLKGEYYEALSKDEDHYLWELLDSSYSKIGGYAEFTQCDPREEGDYATLLLQLDTIDNCLMWGDCGIGNFFIQDKAKKTADFSDVLYNWDCY